MQSHADDLASVVAALPAPPVLVGHSFGGMLAEKYVGQMGRPGQQRPPLAGLALLASVPPTGNGAGGGVCCCSCRRCGCWLDVLACRPPLVARRCSAPARQQVTVETWLPALCFMSPRAKNHASNAGNLGLGPLAGSIIKRITFTSLKQSWKITMAFVFKSFVKSLDECRCGGRRCMPLEAGSCRDLVVLCLLTGLKAARVQV